MKVTITEFLEARISEDEVGARAATPSPWGSMIEETVDGDNVYFTVERNGEQIVDVTATDHQGRMTADFIARHDPARVLAECAAKRWALDTLCSYEPADEWDTEPDMGRRGNNAAGAVRRMAAVYKEHPDYRQEWATDAD